MILVMKYLVIFYLPSILSEVQTVENYAPLKRKKCVFKNVDNKKYSPKTSLIVEKVKKKFK